MTLLITGATGFVMSVLARHVLEADPAARVVALDAAPPDAAAQRYFAPVADRLRLLTADVTLPETWQDAVREEAITAVVHGATITPISRGTAATARIEPEAEQPRRIVEVNVMGTVAVLEVARTLPGLRRVIYVSSGSVYRHHGPDHPGAPLPEDGYVAPRRLYGISKHASELIAARYGELFGLSVAGVRLSSVYGTMDRATASRDFRHVPNRIAHAALRGGRRITVNTLDAVGDYIHAEDVARAIAALLAAPTLRHDAYNIALGETASIGTLVAWAAERAPRLHAAVVDAAEAEIVADPTLTGGMWGAYDIARITAETGWRPRPMREALHAYIDWLHGS
jgi:nucleoside-diphosphate-sugar epimerase